MLSLTQRLKQRAINFIGGESYRNKQEDVAKLIDVAWRQGPALLSSHTLHSRLGEVDERLLDMLLQQQSYDLLYGVRGQPLKLTEQDRLRTVYYSRYFYQYNTQYENAVSMWTDFGFGQQIDIVPLDDKAKEIWEECWKARRNTPLFKQRSLHELSDDIVIDGEEFFVGWASTVDGKVTWRRLATDKVKEIIYDKDDTDVPVFYRVTTDTGEVYFPDWQPTDDELDEEWEKIKLKNPGAKRADELAPTIEIGGEQETRTDVRVIQAAHNKRGGRGWPAFFRGTEWMESLKTHLGDHLTVASAVATFVDEIKTKGGSRGVDEIAAKFASTLTTSTDRLERNPSPAAGSVFVHNEAIESKRRPLSTAAGDAQTTTGLVVGQISSSTKVPPHWMGFPQFAQNRATARETSRPFIEQMERYQEFWSDVFQDIVAVTLYFAVKYGSEYNEKTFTSTEAAVTFESPQRIDPSEIATMIGAIDKAATGGALDPDVAQNAIAWLVATALVNLGARNVEAILEPQEEETDTDDEPSASQDMSSERLAAVARVIGENMIPGGGVELAQAIEWAVASVVDEVRGEVGDD